METDRIIVTDEDRIVGWQDGATVAWIRWEIRRSSGRIDWWAHECDREEEATALLLLIDRDRDCRLVNAELVRRVTPEDLMAEIAPDNWDVAQAGWSRQPELCACADEVLYTVTARSPDGTAVTVGPMSRASPIDPDVVAGIASDLRKEKPGAEITVESGPNPDYRRDCLRVIPEGAAYVEYVGARRGSGGKLYCQRCAIGIWGE